MIIGYYNKSIILTFIGLFSTIFGISFAINDEIYLSLICLLISGLCDTFDGTIARHLKRNDKEKEYGIQLDSLVDVVSFGLFPIIICYGLGYKSYINILIYCIYIFCGITRLAYFNIDSENAKYFKGLPITMSSFILSIIILITTNQIVIMITLLLLAFLFILKIKIPKSNLKLKLFYLLIGLFIVGLLILKII